MRQYDQWTKKREKAQRNQRRAIKSNLKTSKNANPHQKNYTISCLFTMFMLSHQASSCGCENNGSLSRKGGSGLIRLYHQEVRVEDNHNHNVNLNETNHSGGMQTRKRSRTNVPFRYEDLFSLRRPSTHLASRVTLSTHAAASPYYGNTLSLAAPA